jgi:transketolase
MDVLMREIAREARNNKDVYVVHADGYGVFFNSIPREQVINAGIAEQNVISIASGLALTGKTVYAAVMGIYASTRALEQVRVDCAYNNAKVRILGLQSGLSTAAAGYSHWAVEDIASMRTLPNIAVVAPTSSKEITELMKHNFKGPVYWRFDHLWGYDFNDCYRCEFGKLSTVIDGADFAIIALGRMVEYAYNLVSAYNSQGKNPLLLSAHTLKPFDKKKIVEIINSGMPIITIEEHCVGGLGSIVAEIIAESNKAVKFLPVFIKDNQFNYTGSYEYLTEKLMNLSSLKDRIDSMTNGNKIRIKLIYCKIHQNKRKYLLFNFIPLLKIKKCKKVKQNKLPYKYYLFGFLRIL